MTSLKSAATSLLARPSSGGDFTRTISLLRHPSIPSTPERFDLGETVMSTSVRSPRPLQTSATVMSMTTYRIVRYNRLRTNGPKPYLAK